MLVAHCAHGPQVGERDRLPAAGVVRHRHHDEGDAVHADFGDGLPQRVDIHVALERMKRRRVATLGNHQIPRLGVLVLDVGAGRVEVRVVGNDVARLQHHGEEDALRRPALVGRDDLGEAGELLDRVTEAVVRLAAGVGLVAVHHPGPLLRRHRPGARVGEQVDDHLVGVEPEEVVPGSFERPFPLLTSGEIDGLDAVDAERLDDGAKRHGFPPEAHPESVMNRPVVHGPEVPSRDRPARQNCSAAAAQWKPAPNAVKTTRSPSAIRPFCRASHSENGTVAEPVLPYSWTLT